MSLKPGDLVKNIKSLVPVPDIAFKLNELVDNDAAGVNDALEVLATDPVLAAKLLHIANSPVYGNRTHVDTLERAVMLVGMNGIRELVWAAVAMESFVNSNIPSSIHKLIWSQSLYTATLARNLASKCRVMNKSRLFLAGLLHDIGRLVMYQCLPKEMNTVMSHVDNQNMSLIDAEYLEFGFSHAEVGGELLKSWNLPSSLVDTAFYHHEPSRCALHKMESAVVNVAMNIAEIAVQNKRFDLAQLDVSAKTWGITGLNKKAVESVIEVSENQYQNAKQIFFIPTGIAA